MPDTRLERGALLVGVALIVLLLVLTIRAWGDYGARLDRATAGATPRTAEPGTVTESEAVVDEPPPSAPDPAAPTWIGNFETGSFSQWDGLQAAGADRITVTTDPVRQGRYAARFELRPGDLRGAGSERAEILQASDEGEGIESWWSWSVYFPSDEFVPTPGDEVVFTQWHDNGSEAISPPVLFRVVDEGGAQQLDFRVRGGDPDAAVEQAWQLGALQQDHWYDFTFHVRWSSQPDGFVELWLDGEQVVARTELPTLYTGLTNYLKQGNSRHASDVTSTLYIDGTVRGRTRAAVS